MTITSTSVQYQINSPVHSLSPCGHYLTFNTYSYNVIPANFRHVSSNSPFTYHHGSCVLPSQTHNLWYICPWNCRTYHPYNVHICIYSHHHINQGHKLNCIISVFVISINNTNNKYFVLRENLFNKCTAGIRVMCQSLQLVLRTCLSSDSSSLWL